MTKIIALDTNCWQAFLACMTDMPLSMLAHCSTQHDDWKEATSRFLGDLGGFYIETSPKVITALPDQALIGAHVNGQRHPHIVIAKVIRDNDLMAFEVYHDPSGKFKTGLAIHPETIVLICRLMR